MVDLKVEYIDLRSDNQGELTDSDVSVINDLLVELSSKAPKIDKKTLLSTLSNCHIVVARVDSKIVGMGCLVPTQQLTGYFGRIEDVVVSSRARNLGIGRGILGELIKIAMELGISRVDLSSKPERVVANKLYESMGFVRRSTNVYRLEF